MSNEQEVLKVQNLTKNFGNFVALDGLNFSLSQGQCMGYLGPNGSGKSTAIKILTGLSKPTSGKAFIFGREIGKDTRRAMLDVDYCALFSRGASDGRHGSCE